MRTEFDQAVGKNIRRLRSLNGWTQQGLGDQIGVSGQQVQKYENGGNRVTLLLAYQLKQIFQVGWEELLPEGAASKELVDEQTEFRRVRHAKLYDNFQKLTPQEQHAVAQLVKSLSEQQPMV